MNRVPPYRLVNKVYGELLQILAVCLVPKLQTDEDTEVKQANGTDLCHQNDVGYGSFGTKMMRDMRASAPK